MNTDLLFNKWKTLLLEINNGINIKEEIIEKNTEDEEYYFYLNYDDTFSFYCFNDNWGKGIGIHQKEKNDSIIWYFENYGIDEELKEDYMFKILKDVVMDKKLFWLDDKEDMVIELGDYIESYSSIKPQSSLLHNFNEINGRRSG